MSTDTAVSMQQELRNARRQSRLARQRAEERSTAVRERRASWHRLATVHGLTHPQIGKECGESERMVRKEIAQHRRDHPDGTVSAEAEAEAE